jgi:hypothetical protein
VAITEARDFVELEDQPHHTRCFVCLELWRADLAPAALLVAELIDPIPCARSGVALICDGCWSGAWDDGLRSAIARYLAR